MTELKIFSVFCYHALVGRAWYHARPELPLSTQSGQSLILQGNNVIKKLESAFGVYYYKETPPPN